MCGRKITKAKGSFKYLQMHYIFKYCSNVENMRMFILKLIFLTFCSLKKVFLMYCLKVFISRKDPLKEIFPITHN